VASTLPDVTRPHDPSADRPRRSAAGGPGGVAAQLRRMLEAGELDLPRPGGGHTARRWAVLADWGGRDLSLARLAEGHVDALAILAEAGRAPVKQALYGVWASRSGGAALAFRNSIRDAAGNGDGGVRDFARRRR